MHDVAQQIATPFRETSARLATNIDSLFEEITERVLNNKGSSIMEGSGVSTNEKPANEERGGENIRKLMSEQKMK